MRLNLNQLHVFYLAAKYKSLKTAAALLYVSPSAVTMQIKKLESWLGFPVFERGQGKLGLTERGLRLYDYVCPVFIGLDKLEKDIADMMLAEESELRFGTHHLPANYFIPDLIAHVRAKNPALKVHLELGTQDSLLEMLFQQKLDIALIIGGQPEGTQCKAMHLFDVEVALVTASNGQFGEIDSISVKDIGNIPLILQQKGTGALRSVLAFLAAHNAQPNILLDNISSDVIKTFLQKMSSGAFISRFIVQKELDGGVFHEIKIAEGSPVCRFQLAYADSPTPPLKLTRFLNGVSGFMPSFKAFK